MADYRAAQTRCPCVRLVTGIIGPVWQAECLRMGRRWKPVFSTLSVICSTDTLQHAVFTFLDANHHTEDWTFMMGEADARALRPAPDELKREVSQVRAIGKT
jgi:hypothetical protein